MNKREAMQDFRENVLPAVKARYEQDGRKDRPARAEAWNNYTDALQKDGRITRRQVDSWVAPKECN